MNQEDRPPIPADLRRRVLVEAGHRCAISTCRHPDVDVHHIIPWSKCKEHEYENLIALCPNCHRKARKGEIDKKSLRIYKNNLCFAIEKFSQFEMDVLFELSKAIPGMGIPFPTYLSLLIKRLLDADFVKIREVIPSIQIGVIKTTPDSLEITNKGRQFIESLERKETGY